MNSIKGQKLQAMKNHKKAQFAYNLVVYSLTAFLSSLFYLYMFWFPSLRHFFFDFLPNMYSFFLSPKFLFILGNSIVIILVRESKLAGSRSSPATEIYDVYVERSRSLRRQNIDVCKKKDGKPEREKRENNKITRHASLNNIRCLEVKKTEMAGRSLRRPRSIADHKEDSRQEMHENEKTTLVRSFAEKRRKTVSPSLERPQSLGRLDMHENEKITMAITRGDDLYNIRSLEEKKEKTAAAGQSLARPQSLGRLDHHLHENEIKTSDDDDLTKMSLQEKRQEMELSMDELNRRVEEFIARVNKQRMVEARELDSIQD